MTDVQNAYELLYQLGISANYTGFAHTDYALSLCMERQERLRLVTKWLYPDVAKKYGTSWKTVERNIRTVSVLARTGGIGDLPYTGVGIPPAAS